MTLLLALALVLAGAAPAAADPVVGDDRRVPGHHRRRAQCRGLRGRRRSRALGDGDLVAGRRLPADRPRRGALRHRPGADAEAAEHRPGVRHSVQLGDDAPGTIILGRYATAGDLVYVGSHGEKNKYYTFVVELADCPGAAPPGDGQRRLVTLSASADPPYGKPVVEYRQKGKDRLWIKFHDGTQTAPDHGLLTVYGDDPFRPWQADMLGLGVPYAVVTACYDPEVHRGVPKVLFELDGARLYDPRQDSSVGGAGPQRWSDPSSWTPFGGARQREPGRADLQPDARACATRSPARCSGAAGTSRRTTCRSPPGSRR